MILKTEKLIIRHIVADDWKSIKDIWVDFNTSTISQYDKPHITDDADVQPCGCSAENCKMGGSERRHRAYVFCRLP